MKKINLKKFLKIGCALVLLTNLFMRNASSMETSGDLGAGDIGIPSSESLEFQKHHEGLDDRPTKLPVPGKKTLLNFLLIAVYPTGLDLYTWGGGWNPQDAGTGVSSKTIGLRQPILDFARSHYAEDRPNTEAEEKEERMVDGKFKWDNVTVFAVGPDGAPLLRNGKPFLMYKYIYDGMDCSGFVGWVVYNLVNNVNGNEGYVGSSTSRAEFFSKKGWGKLREITKEQIENNKYEFHPGDIVSIKGHVYISLGKCADGSILLVHSSNPGICIMGTTDRDGNLESEAIKLAKEYNAKYPKWFAWYNRHDGRNFSRPFERYLTGAKCFTWDVDGNILTDPEGIQKMAPQEVLEQLFNV